MSHLWNRHARIEYFEAIGYYARIDDALGERFVAAVEDAVEQMSLTPERFRRFDGDMRKVRVEEFPYAVIYRIEDRELRIISVMNLHRRPGYWRERLN
jgi:plasmid stabilization system protein ParE